MLGLACGPPRQMAAEVETRRSKSQQKRLKVKKVKTYIKYKEIKKSKKAVTVSN